MGERLLFVIWLSGKVLGADDSKSFAAAIGKGPTQLSRWVSEKSRPEWDTVKKIAQAVGISAMWLDDPSHPDAIEPPDFATWIIPRRAKQKAARRKA